MCHTGSHTVMLLLGNDYFVSRKPFQHTVYVSGQTDTELNGQSETVNYRNIHITDEFVQ